MDSVFLKKMWKYVGYRNIYCRFLSCIDYFCYLAIITYLAIRRRRAAKLNISSNQTIGGYGNPIYDEVNPKTDDTNLPKTENTETRFNETGTTMEGDRTLPREFTNVVYDKTLDLVEARRNTDSKYNFGYSKFNDDND